VTKMRQDASAHHVVFPHFCTADDAPWRWHYILIVTTLWPVV